METGVSDGERARSKKGLLRGPRSPIRFVAPEPPRDAERLEGDDVVNAVVRLQAMRVRQELGRLRTALVVKADREFGEGEGRAIYVEWWEG